MPEGFWVEGSMDARGQGQQAPRWPPRVRAPLGAPKPEAAGVSPGPEASPGRRARLVGRSEGAAGSLPGPDWKQLWAFSFAARQKVWRVQGVRGYSAARPRPHQAGTGFQPTQASKTRGASEVSEHPPGSTGDIVPWDRTSPSRREPPASGPRSLVPCLPLRAIGVPRLPRRGPIPSRCLLLSSFSDLLEAFFMEQTAASEQESGTCWKDNQVRRPRGLMLCPTRVRPPPRPSALPYSAAPG